MDDSSLKYNRTDANDIERFAQLMIGHSLKEIIDSTSVTIGGKGKVGQLIEKYYFGYELNSNSEPDFKEAGVELKCTPMKELKDKSWVAKERLVLNIINYEEEWKRSFRESSFWHKNAKLLLMFYLWNENQTSLDYIFKIVRLWEFPLTDLKIIKDDWQTIINKVKSGNADEISEGDTLYLAACMKGASKELSKRKQPFSDKPAQQRAYSLKNRYMSYVIDTLVHKGKDWHVTIDEEMRDWILDEWERSIVNENEAYYHYLTKKHKYEAVISNVSQYKPGETFEQYVEKQFKAYYGLLDVEIENMLGLEQSKAKNRYSIIAKKILGISKESEIEEFAKAGITIKTIRLEESGKLKEAMSFKQIQFMDIVNESWEDSYWYDILNHKFFFVVFQKEKSGNLRLKNAFFWNMPYHDLQIAKEFWLDTKAKIQNDDFEHFIKSSDDRICHVRPKGIDSKDLMRTPSGRMEKKKCFWLNRKYIYDILQSHLNS